MINIKLKIVHYTKKNEEIFVVIIKIKAKGRFLKFPKQSRNYFSEKNT